VPSTTPASLGQGLGDLEAGALHRLARGEERELGEAVVEGELLAREMRFRAGSRGPGRRPRSRAARRRERRAADAAPALAHRLQILRRHCAERADRALAGDDDAPHALRPAPRRAPRPPDDAGDRGDVEGRLVRRVRVERDLDVEGLLDGEDRLDEPERVDAELLERHVRAHVAGSSTACSARMRITFSLTMLGHIDLPGTVGGRSSHSEVDWEPVLPRGFELRDEARQAAQRLVHLHVLGRSAPRDSPS
jgi:hypothetical protein